MAQELNLWGEVEETSTTPQAEETATENEEQVQVEETQEVEEEQEDKATEKAEQDNYVTEVIGSIPMLKEWLKTQLDARAKEDELFAKTYAKPNKSIDECERYIMHEMEKIARKQKQGNYGFVCGDDSTLVAIAIHYYDEDSIKVATSPKPKASTSKAVKNSKPTAEQLRNAKPKGMAEKVTENFSENKPKFVQLSLF